ncbi:hypothetical protein K523DRAFT_59662 [Schizophyllum commune Tattone D]|nr:hypothetical protein K523DRAFT_59662 [Schizophyllum commune Tattone D]
MKGVTRTRAVWLDALKRICLSYGVPFVTYDFERMSREQLEHAATSPDRFLHSGRSAMNSPSVVLYAIEERRLPLPPSRRVPFANNELRWEDLVLLPGGRFVLGYTGALLVWDLASDSDYPFVAMDEINDFSPGLKMYYVHLGSLGYYPAASNIRLVVSATCKSEDYATTAPQPAIACLACELSLAESPPALRVLGALHDAAFICFAGSGSRIAFYSRTNTRIVGVWDSEQGVAASWESKGSYHTDERRVHVHLIPDDY